MAMDGPGGVKDPPPKDPVQDPVKDPIKDPIKDLEIKIPLIFNETEAQVFRVLFRAAMKREAEAASAKLKASLTKELAELIGALKPGGGQEGGSGSTEKASEGG
jgi:hypothetical protein